MAHGVRKKSATGYYHVVPKGRGNRLIFLSDADRVLYLSLLAQSKTEYGFLLHAYCLMSNHTHLIIEDLDDNLSEAMKFIHERYAAYFAEATGQVGGTFRRPYWSEPIDTDSHLLCAVRYTHANPAAAGICAASRYDWSSAKDYLGRAGITDTEMVLDMLGGRNGFVEFSQPSNWTADPFPGSRLLRHLSDNEAFTIARSVLGQNPATISQMTSSERANAVRLLHDHGITNSQMSRLVGLNESTIRCFIG